MPARSPVRRPRLGPAAATLLLSALIVGACAERAQWVNEDAPQERWGQDRAACRERADRLAGRQLERDRSSDWISGDTGALSEQFAVEDAKRLRRDLYNRCMGARGYELKGE
ncbi:MAG: hypothetical protein RIB45_06675 [Marivibrio sp.]|uniref:hypothetical protein n=1 Tax=Marivibrio sp. TaxID=2039719 RepID=UPI0032EDF460